MNTSKRSIALRLAAGLVLATFLVSCGDLEDDASDTQGELTFSNVTGTNSPFLYDSGTKCGSVLEPNMHCCPPNMVMVGAHLSRGVFKCAKTAGFVPGSAISGWGPSLTRFGMAACPEGKVMTGYGREINNHEAIVCAKVVGTPVSLEYVDSSAVDTFPMHVCLEKGVSNPGRFAMSGIHASTNRFLCAQ